MFLKFRFLLATN